MRPWPASRSVARTSLVPALLLLAACLPRNLETTSEAPSPSKVQVRFLGVGGFVIRRGSDVVMTAPLYSNPRPGELLAEEILPNTPVLDRYFVEHDLGPEMEDLRAVLVGHAHYDHLMDVPYVLGRAPGARVYGSVTTRRILAGYGGALAARVTALNDPSANYTDFTACPGTSPPGCVHLAGQPGRWLDVAGSGGRVRIQAFCSAHPPQVLQAIHFWPGCQNADLTSPPRRSVDYVEGEVLSFLVDFMEAGRPAFRVYYQDAPVTRPVGWVPATVIAERPVDLALLCTGTFDAVQDPQAIVSQDLQAREVVLHHWEDFFDPKHGRLTMIPGCDVDRFFRAVTAELDGDARRVHVLAPGVLRNFPRP